MSNQFESLPVLAVKQDVQRQLDRARQAGEPWR